MSERDAQLEEVGRLTGLLLADALDDAGRRRLEESLLADPAAMEYYQDYVDVHCLLHWQHGLSEEQGLRELGSRTAADGQSNLAGYEIDLTGSDSLSPHPSSLSPAFVGGPVFSYMVATVVLCAMLLGAWAYKTTVSTGEYADVRHWIDVNGAAEFVVVGRITAMTPDCRWADPDSAAIVGSKVRKGRGYSLASGLMEITYDCGAKVILEGPCDYTADSRDGGFLRTGKLVARVEKNDELRMMNDESHGHNSDIHHSSFINHPLFSVRTPTAIVTDLGTEFGVEVDTGGNTTSCVFRGTIKVEAGDKESIVLHADESMRVEKAGGERETQREVTLNGKVRFIHPTDTPKFVRRMAEPPKQLDLLDIIAGGDGMGHRRERGIDPASGRFDAVFSTGYPKDEHQYHRVDWPRFVDGVFIPLGGEEPVQVDSAGHTFAFPATSGDTFGTIWARAAEVRRKDLADEKYYWMYSMGDAERFMPKMRGILCLHANAGITFNLKAMRQALPGSTPSGFTAVAGMADSGRFAPDACGQADLWVFVDGRLKWKRIGLRTQEGPVPINVELGPDTRFLTLVTTDGGNESACDWVVFGDPVLDLTASQLEEAQTVEH